MIKRTHDRCDIHFDYDWQETNTYLNKIVNDVIYLLNKGDEYLVTLNEIKVDAMSIIFQNDSIDLYVSNENDHYQTWRGTIPLTWVKKGSFSVVMTINERNILLYQGLMNMINYDEGSSTFNILVDIPNNFIYSSDDSINVVRNTDGNFDVKSNLEFTSEDKSVTITKTDNTYDFKVNKVEETTITSSDNSVEITKEDNNYDLKVKVTSDTNIMSSDNSINVIKVDNGYDLKAKAKVGDIISSVVLDSSKLNIDTDFIFTPSGDVNLTLVDEDIKAIENVGSLASFTQGDDEFNQGTLATFNQGEDAYTSSSLEITTDENEGLVFNFTQGTFTQGTDTFTQGVLPTFKQGKDTYVDAVLPSVIDKKVVTDLSANFVGNEVDLSKNYKVNGNIDVTYNYEDKNVTFIKED